MDDDNLNEDLTTSIARGQGTARGQRTGRHAVQFYSLDSESSRTERLALTFVRAIRRGIPTALLIFGDLTALITAGQTAIWLRHVVAPTEFHTQFYPVLLIYSALIMLAYLATGLYGPVARSSPDELRRVTLTTTTLALVMAIVTYVSRSRWDIGVFIYVIAWGFALVTVPLFRAIIRGLFADRRWWGRKAIILARNMDTAYRLVRTLEEEPRIGLRPTAILTTDAHAGEGIPGLPQLHGTGPALTHARAHGIDYAIVTTSDLNDVGTMNLIRRYETFFKHWLIVPYAAQSYSLWVRSRDFNGMLGLELTHRLLKRGDQAAKRLLDFILTLLSSTIVAPMSLLIAIAIKLDSKGPVLYRQTRLGRNGQAFPAFKFRSMVENADDILDEYLEQHPELREEWDATRKLKRDPRITRVGHFLRRTSLDELPQLLNVLRGDMSLVGPRPIVEDEISRYGWVWELYKRVRPGVTGQWQISGRNDTSYEDRTAMDAYYVRNWSVWLDLHILARTVIVVLSRRGAY